jgi:hypothetical protein
MSEPIVVGLKPWLPGPLARWTWWTEPVRAERLAALRIGVALVLLFDVLGTYLPQAHDFFGRGSLGSPEVFAGMTGPGARWTLLRGIENPALMQAALVIWAAAAVCLLLGICPRASAATAWLFSMSVMGLNRYLCNSGDNVRTIALFYLMLCPCGAAWSVQAWWSRRRAPRSGPVYVPAWPLRLLVVQLALIYFVNGLYKFSGSHWRGGDIMHDVMANLAWTRFSYAQLPLPEVLIPFLTWITLFWELGFPLLIMMPFTRKLALWMGVAFHLGTGLFLQLGPFPLYMIALYLPLVPWEKGRGARGEGRGEEIGLPLAPRPSSLVPAD